MELNCCACGKAIPEKIEQAIINEQYSRRENAPIIGIVCDDCEKDLSTDKPID